MEAPIMFERIKKCGFLFLLLATIACSITACGTRGGGSSRSPEDADAKFPKKNMRVGIGVSDSHFQYKGLQQMEEYIERESKGSIAVELFHSGQIGSNEQVLEAIKARGAEMGTCDPSSLGNFVPEFNLLGIPFLFKTADEGNTIAQKSTWSKKLLSKLENAGYKGFGLCGYGFRHITNNIRPITQISDLSGMKIRTMQTPIHLSVFRALGANPTPMSYSELFSAMQQGVIDGQENPLMNIYTSKFQEVQKYLTLSEHVYAFIVLVSGTKWFDSLSPEQKPIVQDGADIAIIFIQEAVKTEDEKVLQLLNEAGIKVNELSSDALSEMQKIAKPVSQEFAKTINLEFYEELIAEIDSLK
jgi:tripartite ATP-independent transporter DctP family solute receptor